MVRQGIKKIIAPKSDLRVVGELADGLELLEFLDNYLPQLIILDISMPYLGGIEATRMVKAGHPGIKILILTLHNRREYVEQARLAGAEGYLLKDRVDRELLAAIATLRSGGAYLSPGLVSRPSDSPAEVIPAPHGSNKGPRTNDAGTDHCHRKRAAHRT